MDYIDEEVQFLMDETGCDSGEAMDYLDASEDYLVSIGVLGNISEEDLHASPENTPVVETDKLVAYVVEKTGLSRSLVEKLSDAELDYLLENGLAEEA